MISDPGAAKTLAWPRGRRGGSAGEGEGGGGGGGVVHAFLLGGPGSGQSSETACVRFWLLLGATRIKLS